MNEEEITPPGYPGAILKGDVVAKAYRGLRRRLESLFPTEVFKHIALPPHASRRTWDEIVNDTPAVAVGIGTWQASGKAVGNFIGDLTFPVAVLQSQSRSEDLYLGTGKIRGMGVAGIMAALAGGLNGWKLPDVASCRVGSITLPNTEDWFGDRAALVVADVVFPNVGLDNTEALEELDEFLSHRDHLKIMGQQNGE
ncbi:hypothetical protein GS501_02430 [Saccharibacter sp. 17.LH.SD]|uniref:hypothetical protein n=1 Tax=Saccharibacter sp. 17.LH.SD TaxID=2689393 RepID=UPI00136DC2B5|nr:hypothetical protein [Saccharibacter sp. 17.LH.SD]MXV43909.1 hypothetical protein [Saccharibacter sp. 17.LH.SD]